MVLVLVLSKHFLACKVLSYMLTHLILISFMKQNNVLKNYVRSLKYIDTYIVPFSIPGVKTEISLFFLSCASHTLSFHIGRNLPELPSHIIFLFRSLKDHHYPSNQVQRVCIIWPQTTFPVLSTNIIFISQPSLPFLLFHTYSACLCLCCYTVVESFPFFLCYCSLLSKQS